VRDLLVTGTDTGVGKTLVAAALLLALRERGARALGFKPAETGVSPEDESDSSVLAQASGVTEERVRPLLHLEEALAPAVAAERARVTLDPERILETIRELRAGGYALVVEGAGGILVPLAWGFTALDLAVRAKLEAVVVARAGLGTLNHVLLTVEALERRGVALRGIILNGVGSPPDVAETTNPEALRRLLPGVPILVLPREPRGPTLAIAARFTRQLGSLLSP
jgi:dethiobiotin synthetase